MAILAVFAGIIAPYSALSSNDEEIKKKQVELTQLRKEIEAYEDRISETARRESATLELLDNYDRQTGLLKKLLASFRDEEKDLQRQIEETRKTITALSSQLAFAKRHYAKYVQSIFKYGRTYDLELLLTSRSVNQLFIRAEYLKKFSSQRKDDIQKIAGKRVTIENENLILQSQLSRERKLIAEKSKEEERLHGKIQKRTKLLADTRRDKKNYQREIERKRNAAKDVEGIISRLVEEERMKAEREAELAREGKISLPTEGLGIFDGRKGKLRWPVPHGRLAARFGNQQHPVLKTITQNTGIDIAVPVGTDVVAVADGIVSTIYWLPSFGNLIILNHAGGYRTVYAHLSDIEAREGEKVLEGSRVGKSGEALSGPLVHFEVWKYREKQDPEIWLRPQGLTQR